MTKVNMESEVRDNDTLFDLEVGDFFFDEQKHLCMFVERETEDFVVFYDFYLEKMRRCYGITDVTYIREVKIVVKEN